MNANQTNQITLTAEQLINIVGHAATQEQLDNVRRELDTKIERLDTKVERVAGELDAKIDRVASELGAKIERVAGELDAKIERVATRTDSKIDSLKNWMLATAFTMIVTVAAATAFLVDRLPPQ